MNILIYTIGNFDIKCGGLVVQYNLAKILKELGINVKIRASNNIVNPIFNDYYLNENIDFDNTVVIYGETIEGNPINAKYIVRWILAPLGVIADENIYKTWNKNDLVYYFNSENKFFFNKNKIGNIYKLLNCVYISPIIKNINLKRNGICHTFRKSHMHKNNKFKLIHPKNSFEIKQSFTQEQIVNIFNSHKIFISYDPLTFLNIMAALCGCISIVQKVKGLNKEQWLRTTVAYRFFKIKGLNGPFGIAYGLEDLNYAIKTIHLVKYQWNNILEFNKKQFIENFLYDINNYKNMINNVENNYII